ncbi:hypothetical protein [Rhizobium rhizosphaerae]|nr:hypothetical protein [Xaviernesmea rhizosphaerae]
MIRRLLPGASNRRDWPASLALGLLFSLAGLGYLGLALAVIRALWR